MKRTYENQINKKLEQAEKLRQKIETGEKKTREKIAELQKRAEDRLTPDRVKLHDLEKSVAELRKAQYKDWVDELLQEILACPYDSIDLDAVSPADVVALLQHDGNDGNAEKNTEPAGHAEAAQKQDDEEKPKDKPETETKEPDKNDTHSEEKKDSGQDAQNSEHKENPPSEENHEEKPTDNEKTGSDGSSAFDADADDIWSQTDSF